MYADYTFYTDVFFGKDISAADFPRLSSRASDFLDYYTRGKAVDAEPEAIRTALAKACCAVAEAMQTNERAKALANKTLLAALASGSPELKSESVGSYSVSYATSGDFLKGNEAQAVRDERIQYTQIALQYLYDTGLLYRGGC
ncbi:MAG: hypothetical protein IKU30_02125 [Clostridia bacterium]|nr:hypothetical protein [Clostridia bacterium]